MAITFPKAPEGGQRIVHEFISHTLLAGPCILKNAEIEDLTIVNPHQAYTLVQGEKTSRMTLSTANPNLWQYFIMRGDEAIALARLKVAGGILKVTELQTPATGLNLALKKAQRLPQVGIRDYEFRFLNIRPFLCAAWIYNAFDNIFYLLPPTYKRFDTNTPYSEDRFIEILNSIMATSMTKAQYEQFMRRGDTIRQTLMEKCRRRTV
jgi:hypothetical protein